MRIDHTDDDSIARCKRAVTHTITGLRQNLRRELERAAPNPGDRGRLELDIRLVSNQDGELWFATGDVSYDTVHGAACGASSIASDSSDDDVSAVAVDLVDQVVDGLAQRDAEDDHEQE